MSTLFVILALFGGLFAAVALAVVAVLLALAVRWLAPHVLTDELVEGR